MRNGGRNPVDGRIITQSGEEGYTARRSGDRFPAAGALDRSPDEGAGEASPHWTRRDPATRTPACAA